ncbi:TPA: hypothetical protein DIU22_00700 [Candidatus Woesebacteria bacterium]|nr:MAG: hypothetical protein A2616_01575 [Candidatus Woesebacteria bacterium RIFOXYD1_FULL_33_11]HCR35551.1 hypothetical protein [Candidatus Woesebacteria bacterium]
MVSFINLSLFEYSSSISTLDKFLPNLMSNIKIKVEKTTRTKSDRETILFLKNLTNLIFSETDT